MENQSALIGTAEVCRRLGIHASTVSRWVKAGDLTPVHKMPTKNGAYLFRSEDIEQLRERAS